MCPTSARSLCGLGSSAIAVDLAKLSAEELTLAFRRACLQHHPSRADGSLGGLLCVHWQFELVALTWASLLDGMLNIRSVCLLSMLLRLNMISHSSFGKVV